MPPKDSQQALELSEDLGQQQREWTLQRIGWVLMTLFVLAASLGLLGHGGFAKQEIKTGNLAVEYERFVRYEAPATLTVHVANPTGDTVRIWIDADHAEKIRFDRIVPEPSTTRLGTDRLVFAFPADSAQQTVVVSFHYTPESVGRARGRIGLENGPTASFWQLIYP